MDDLGSHCSVMDVILDKVSRIANHEILKDSDRVRGLTATEVRRKSGLVWICQHRDMVCEMSSWLLGCSLKTPICGYLPVVTRSIGPFQRQSRDLAILNDVMSSSRDRLVPGATVSCQIR